MQYMENNPVERLESYRLENKITLQELAKLLEVNYTTLYRWFSSKTKPSKIQQYHIEKLLKSKTWDKKI
jgi:transcriptional regulator with XRE-family HTH domain